MDVCVLPVKCAPASESDIVSGLGQRRRFERRPTTSGLPSTPDILSARRHVSNGPMLSKKGLRRRANSDSCLGGGRRFEMMGRQDRDQGQLFYESSTR
jgi:hypothetical protein